MVKVYNSDGKHVDSFKKAQSKKEVFAPGFINWDSKIKHLNKSGFYIKGQTTSKGIKIK